PRSFQRPARTEIANLASRKVRNPFEGRKESWFLSNSDEVRHGGVAPAGRDGKRSGARRVSTSLPVVSGGRKGEAMHQLVERAGPTALVADAGGLRLELRMRERQFRADVDR